MLQNLSVTRVEANDFADCVKWAPNGEIALNTTNQLTFLRPKYLNLSNDQQVKGTKELFTVEMTKHEDLHLDNYFFKSEMRDEVVSSVFVHSENTIVKFEYSPLTRSQTVYLAVLSNKGTLVIVKDGEFLQKLNPDEAYQSQAKFNEWKFETFEWVLTSDNEISLVVGLKSGGLQLYKLDDNKEQFELAQTIDEASKSPIVKIKSYNETLVITNTANEVIFYDGQFFQILLSQNPFQILDVIKVNDDLIFSTPTKIHKLSIVEKKVTQTVDIDLYQSTRLSLVGLNELLVTIINCKTPSLKLKLDTFQIIEDDLVAPVIKKKLNKWNKKFNDFKNKDPVCKVYGSDFNYNKSILCFVCEIKNSLTLTYSIESETTLYVELVPVPKDKNFKLSTNRGSSLAIYQHYQITKDEALYNEIISSNPADDFNDINYNLNFDKFLNECVVKNRLFHDDSVKATLNRTSESIQDIQYFFAKLILNFIEVNKVNVTNEVDQFVLNNYCLLTTQSLMFPDTKKWSYTILEKFTEHFDLETGSGSGSGSGVTFNAESFKSEEGHDWLRCRLTLLPLLTSKVLVDPIFENAQILNIKESSKELGLYNFGPITRDVLTVLSKISLFSGGILTPMV